MAERILMNEYKSLVKEKWLNIELNDDDIFNWNIALIVLNPDSLYHGGYFKGKITFPQNYPYSPPQFRFTPSLWHPNIYDNGYVCISILHKPGEDEMSGELASERWSPAQRVESVLISIISLLDDAEVSSPANVEAGVQLRSNPGAYKKRVKAEVERSIKDIPEGFEMPTSHEATIAPPAKPVERDEDFWVDSGDEDSFEEMFGGSDSEGELDDQDTGSEPEAGSPL
ncbi:Ubiquitin-conjugating enzyme subunit [Microsporum canis]|uniref:Ubiquitin-conjugating enzyme E2 2 n=1 Tax=Arthroderma otae (strain ATCC MYA-4605 / CBS 113480) TaxID=554155 RepID=C5FIJ9_ARTOC|nr:ubiquitin-conjugating enzyme E2 [Microsporum canis CBS 113480]EEQ29268.1 ubiquitin-conjugating enzyme E2 [Microsporum canis CBS 113480]